MNSDFIFYLKSRILIAKRMLLNMLNPIKFHNKIDLERFPKSGNRFWDEKRDKQRNLEPHFDSIKMGKALAKIKTTPIYEISSNLFTKIDPNQEHLRLGKIENLKVCARHLNGIFIEKGEIFSFWRQIGRPSRAKGFTQGREMRKGRLIPSIGGGICQLSSSLYQTAKNANMEIIERHTHTKVVEGAAFKAGEDANLFWNYVDLRFKASCDIILFVEVTDKELITRIETFGKE